MGRCMSWVAAELRPIPPPRWTSIIRALIRGRRTCHLRLRGATPDRYQRHKQNLALRRVCQRRYYAAVLDGNLHVRTGESHANADRDRDGNSHTDRYAYGDSNGYAHTDSYAYCDSDSYAYTDSYAYGDSNGYAYTDSYAYCDANFVTASNADGPAEVYSDAATAADAAAPSVGPDSEACLALVRLLPDYGGSSVWHGP